MTDIAVALTSIANAYLGSTALSAVRVETTQIWPTGPVASLDIDFLQDWGAAINDAVVTGGASFLTHSRSTTQTGFDESGVLQTAAVDDPVFDHDPGNSDAPLGYLSEGAATNEILRSEEINTTWSASSSPVTADDAVAPDGNTTADKFDDVSGAVNGSLTQVITIPNDSSPWLMKAFLKKTSSDTHYAGMRMYISGGTALFNAHVVLNTNTGVVAAAGADVAASGCVDAGDYWLFWFVADNNGTGNTNLSARFYSAWNSSGAVGADAASTGFKHVWGVEVKNLSDPSSYIKTTTAAATRAKNILTASRAGLSEETVVIQARTRYGAGTIWSHDDGTADERIYIERDASNNIHCIAVDGGVEQCDLDLGPVADHTVFKVAFRWAAGDFQASLGGATKVTEASGTLPTRDTLNFGHDYAALDHFNGHLQVYKHYDSLEDVEALAA